MSSKHPAVESRHMAFADLTDTDRLEKAEQKLVQVEAMNRAALSK